MKKQILLLCLLAAQQAAPQNWRKVEGADDEAYSVAVNPRNQNSLWFGGFNKIFISYDGGRTIARTLENFASMRARPVTVIFIHPVDTSFVLVGAAGCFQSHDNGGSWTQALPDTNILFNGEAIAYEPGRPDTLYIGVFANIENSRRIFFRSFDRGLNWDAIPTNLNPTELGFCSLSPGGNGVLLAGTAARGRISRSMNYGSNWTQVYAAPDADSEVPKITFDKRDASIVWAAVFNLGQTRNGVVLKSTSRGLFWNTITLPGNPWAVETDRLGRVYVGMFVRGLPGAYMTLDGGLIWQNYRSGLPEPAGAGETWMIKSNGEPFGVFLADGDRGAFKLQNFVEVRTTEESPAPRRFGLSQNYPNPFNPETVIEYSLPEDGLAELFIQNLRGQTIRRLLQGFETAGTKRVIWDGRDQNGVRAASGVYIYALRAGGETVNKKLLLMR